MAQRGGGLPGFEDLEVIRTQAGLSVVGFCALLGMPRASWYRWRAAVGAGRPRPGKGPWPAPVVDQIEPLAAKHAEQWAAWGHRKIWGLLTADGVQASQASVRRALARQGLLQPVGYQAERRQLAHARRAVFLDPPTRRNRVWQTDFSEQDDEADMLTPASRLQAWPKNGGDAWVWRVPPITPHSVRCGCRPRSGRP